MNVCRIGSFAIATALLTASISHADDENASGPSPAAPCVTARSLLCMSCTELEALYQSGSMPQAPDGKVRGTVIVAPGSNANRAMSKASRVMWQGKVFDAQCQSAVNKFFGLRIVRAQVYSGDSWMDGRPALILDYRDTSLVYANVRDEVRQVAPGLYLGAMYEEHRCNTQFKMFFILETCVE
jgi:hypothetical protein